MVAIGASSTIDYARATARLRWPHVRCISRRGMGSTRVYFHEEKNSVGGGGGIQREATSRALLSIGKIRR